MPTQAAPTRGSRKVTAPAIHDMETGSRFRRPATDAAGSDNKPMFKGVDMFKTMLRRSLYGLGMVLALLLASGCGGGGGGGDGDDEGTPPPSSAVSGRLWHDNYALDFLDGTQIASLTGAAPERVTTNGPAWPWPDGSQYVTYEWDVSDNYTTVTVSQAGTGDTLHEQEFEGYVRSFRPSPVSKQVFLAMWSDSTTNPGVYVFYDLAAEEVLDTIDASTASVDWLPDGRYLHITVDGDISIGTVGGTLQAAGRFEVPLDKTVNDVWVDPQGARIALQLWSLSNAGSVDESDLWVADIDGSDAGQLTDTRLTSYGKWSPDGRHIAFDVDTGLVCGGGSCAGSCELWYVDADARNVTALPSAGDALKFRVKDSDGRDSTLGCDLLGWTP